MHSNISRVFKLKPGNAFSFITRRAAGLLLPALCFVVACAGYNAAQQPPGMPEQPDLTIDAATRTQVIEGVLKNLNEGYVFPEVAKAMEQNIRDRAAKKEYDEITSAKLFARTLTEHLQAISRDKHLRVNYRAAALAAGESLPGSVRIVRVPEGGGSTTGGGAPMRRISRSPGEASGNSGLEKVETLEGNLGYLDFSMFDASAEANEKVAAAMNKLADTDALIIDLRRCRGGAQSTITHLMSYFFDKSVHLSDAYDRLTGSTNASWSLAEVPGRRYGAKDVYLLTSRFTFSAAEDISYTLKNLRRATLVGETTGGGAHPVMGRRINEHFFVMVPFARYISPVTKTNWEGTGVKPDVEVPADHALKVAQLMALKKLAAHKQDAARSAQLKGLVETLQKEVDELKRAHSKS